MHSLKDRSKKELIGLIQSKENENQILKNKLSDIYTEYGTFKDEYSTFRELFEDSPTPMWEEDITELIEHINKIKLNGVTDFNRYFDNDRNLQNCIRKIKIIKVNEACIKLHQTNSKDHLIENIEHLFTHKSKEAFKKELAAIAQGKTVYQSQTEARTLKGKIIDLSIHLKITKRNIANQSRYFALISTVDISKEQKYENELKTNEKALRLILDTSQDVAMLVDKNGFILETNKACQDLYAVSRSDLIGRKLKYFAEESIVKKRTEAFIKALKEKRKIIFENEAYGKYWKSTITPLIDNDNNVEKLVIFHRDVTKEYFDRKRIRESEIKYKTIFNNIQTSVTHIDFNGNITEINDYHINEIGKGKIPKEKYINSNVIEREAIKDAGIVDNYKGLLKGKPFNLKRIYFPKTTGGTAEYFNLQGTPLFDDNKLTGGLITAENITAQINFEKKIKESEKKFRVLAEMTPVAISIFKNAEVADYFYVNNAWETLSGYSRKELKKIKPIDLIHPDMKNLVLERAKRRLAGKNEPSRYEIKAITKEGKIKWVDFTATVIEFNNSPAILNAAIDITNKKNTERELKEINEKLRNLSKYINRVREEERKNIAREIHDNLGQKLTALNLDVSWIKEKMPPEQTKLINAFNPILELIESSIGTVQKLSTELRPGILDDLGLNNAIQWQTNEVGRRTKINFDLDLTTNEPKLSEDIKVGLFRVYQEAITNIIRHSKANNVNVRLRYKNNKIQFNIVDDGIGMPPEKIDNQKSFGIIGMKERIIAIDGTLKFSQNKPTGTEIDIEIPLKEQTI